MISKEEIGIYREEIKKVSEERMKNQDKSFGGAFYQALNIRFDSKGVEKIRKALMKPRAVNEDTTLKITSNGSPSYRISVKAPNYKQAEDELKGAVNAVLDTLKSEGGVGSFERS